jgi:hypothetical protein
MNFTVENLNINFIYESEEEGGMGWATMEIPSEILIAFLDHHDIEYDLSEDDPHCQDGIEYGQDDIDYWFEDQSNRFRTSNADFQILLYEFMIEYSDRDQIDIEYYGANPFWIFHDICHSRNDITGGTIYVDQYVEEQRIYDGMELARENGLLYTVGYELLANVNKGLQERWGHRLDMNKALEILNSKN